MSLAQTSFRQYIIIHINTYIHTHSEEYACLYNRPIIGYSWGIFNHSLESERQRLRSACVNIVSTPFNFYTHKETHTHAHISYKYLTRGRTTYQHNSKEFLYSKTPYVSGILKHTHKWLMENMFTMCLRRQTETHMFAGSELVEMFQSRYVWW